MNSSPLENQEASTSAKAVEMEAEDADSVAQATKQSDDDELNDKDLDKVMTVTEFLQKSKTFMLDYEKHMFLDTIDTDCLVVCAKCVVIAPQTECNRLTFTIPFDTGVLAMSGSC